ncbi:hypothetical protein [Deinococcus sp.]|uniref:hypothetical protein n=1 Tax=Deinococcus sp. TaxID=47478 RepID=UPI002869D393|nr:hypothetical protein [Deinococcus sp.]
MIRSRPLRTLATLTALGFATATPADAAALYFVRLEVKTASEATCYRFAQDAARSVGLTNVRRGPLEVAGQKSGVYLSTTCVGRGQARVMAVVMATSDSFPAAQQVATEFANKLGGIICFDTPC